MASARPASAAGEPVIGGVGGRRARAQGRGRCRGPSPIPFNALLPQTPTPTLFQPIWPVPDEPGGLRRHVPAALVWPGVGVQLGHPRSAQPGRPADRGIGWRVWCVRGGGKGWWVVDRGWRERRRKRPTHRACRTRHAFRPMAGKWIGKCPSNECCSQFGAPGFGGGFLPRARRPSRPAAAAAHPSPLGHRRPQASA